MNLPTFSNVWTSPNTDLTFIEILTPRSPFSAQPAYELMIHLGSTGYARLIEVK